MKKNQNFRSPSLPVIGAAGILLIGINQVILVYLGGTWEIGLWSFIVTAGLTVVTWGLLWRTRRYVQRMEQYSAIMGTEAGLQSESLTMAGTLAAGIAHEIRNPLTSLRGFLQLYRQTQPRYTEIMLSEVDRINEIVNELLELSKPKDSRMEPRLLSQILNHVITLLTAQANLCSVRLVFECNERAESIVVLCEENKLKQVFINLIKNAIEASSSGDEIRIVLEKVGKQAVIHIQDNGYGISEEVLQHLGKPFYSTKEQGNGLGLMVCLKIIQDHQGSTQFQSAPNQGTIVTVTLPIID